MPSAAPMIPVIIDRVGMGRLSPPVSMRGPDRLTIGAASRIVNKLAISIHFVSTAWATASARR